MTPLDARVADAHDLLTHATLALWSTQPLAALVAFVRDASDTFNVMRSAPDADAATAAALVSVARAAVAHARAELDDALDARRVAAEAV